MPDQSLLQLVVTIEAGTKRDALIEAARPCQDATRREQGCHSYTFYADRESEERLYVIETWADQAALDRHMETSHFKAFKEAVDRHVPGGFAGAVELRKARAI